jgi:hypothetical protein
MPVTRAEVVTPCGRWWRTGRPRRWCATGDELGRQRGPRLRCPVAGCGARAGRGGGTAGSGPAGRGLAEAVAHGAGTAVHRPEVAARTPRASGRRRYCSGREGGGRLDTMLEGKIVHCISTRVWSTNIKEVGARPPQTPAHGIQLRVQSNP